MKVKTSLGFTLVELLVVISIIGILVTIGLSTFMSSQIRARDAQRKSNLREIKSALELFYSDYAQYPAAAADGSISACPFNSATKTGTPCTWGTDEFSDTSGGTTLTTYMKIIPKDPTQGQNYWYKTDADKQSFQIFALLENTRDSSLISAPYNCGGTAGLPEKCNFGISSANTSPDTTTPAPTPTPGS